MKNELLVAFLYRWMRRMIPVAAQLTREQRIDWAHGSAVVENPDVTREMVARAVDGAPPG